uniref:ribosomal protein S17 n=1 Tax=Catenella fusiformis TaxID=3024791 RepID=UPI0027D9F1B9|nr:ribosomal protein S17 [Catenella fusiformis]WCH57569.1 ribosomal protein S17 [Catenella fusiformis]
MPIKETIGTVTSNKMDKTIIVAVKKKIAHKKYYKIVTRTKKYYAHDEYNKCHTGDIVKIQETKPISKNKRWILLDKVNK